MDNGLSPRLRGNLGPLANGILWIGSIPAFAGEPYGKPRSHSRGRVYPRVCGGTYRQRVIALSK